MDCFNGKWIGAFCLWLAAAGIPMQAIAVSCSVTLTPAAGTQLKATDFISGFPVTSENCVNPAGIAFDSSGNVYVSDYAGFSAQGGVYKFPPGGGVAALSNRLNPTPYASGTCASGLAFSKDGQHLYLARQFCGNGGDVVEISTTDASVLRTLASIPCATGLATDPISGDLFVAVPCSAPLAGVPPDNTIHRISHPESNSPTVSVYSSPGASAGLVFAPDGTLYTESFRFDLNIRYITKIAGTNSSSPGTFTYLTSDTTNASGVLPVPNPMNPSQPSLLLTNGGSISVVDLTKNPPAQTVAFTGSSSGVLIVGGPDGCAYATLADRIVRITDASGTCQYTSPSTADVAVSLGAAPSPVAVGNTLTYSAQVINNGPATATGVRFSLSLPNGVSFVSASPGCALSGNNVACSIGSLGAGQTVTETIIVKPGLQGGISAAASISATETDPVAANNSATVVTTVSGSANLPIADLSISFGGPRKVRLGRTVTFSLTIKNNSRVNAPQTVVSGPWPDNVKLTRLPRFCTLTGNLVSCQVGTLPKRKSVTFKLKAKATRIALVQTTATISSSAINDPNPSNNSTVISVNVK